MLRCIWIMFGRIAYIVTWPLLVLYLHKSRRTRLLLTSEDKILVVKGWLSSGKWNLPGGGLHRGEAPSDGVLRETQEEIGYHLLASDLTSCGEWRGTWGKFYSTYYGFTAQLATPPVVTLQKLEIIDSAWLKVSELNSKNASPDVLEMVTRWHR